MSSYTEIFCCDVEAVDSWAKVAAQVKPKLLIGGWVALVGDLGSGKTTFVQALASLLAKEKVNVTSPTFSICQEYGSQPPLLHYDLYRLEAGARLEDADWNPERFAGKYVLVEWADRFAFDDLPPQQILQFRWHGGGRQLRFLEQSDSERLFGVESKGSV